MSNRDHLPDGFTPKSLERALRSRSDAWSYDDQVEQAISLSAGGAHISPQMRMAAGYYELGKRAAEASGRDVSDPNATTDGGTALEAAYRAISQPRTDSF